MITEFRCQKCDKLLAKIKGGWIQIKCSKCKSINEIDDTQKNNVNRE